MITEEVGSLSMNVGYGIDRESLFPGGRSKYAYGVEAAVCRGFASQMRSHIDMES
jgi:hypothetical protein